MRTTPHMLDPGVRKPVELLNSIDGVTTRASCEGEGEVPIHPHSALAYVTFEYPLPPRFQEFLIAELGMIGRVDNDAVYCRWPPENRRFLKRLRTAVERYKRRSRKGVGQSLVASLSDLRSRLLTCSTEGKEAVISACRQCMTLAFEPHDCETGKLTLLRWSPRPVAEPFRDFVAQEENRLDPALIAARSPAELEERARRGDFGASFRRRWLRYQRRRARDEMIDSLRDGVQRLRRAGSDLDIVFDSRQARVVWRASGRSDGRGHAGRGGIDLAADELA